MGGDRIRRAGAALFGALFGAMLAAPLTDQAWLIAATVALFAAVAWRVRP